MRKKENNSDFTTLVYGKVPPQSIEIEEVILGAILIQADCLPLVLNSVFPDVFYVEAHSIIYRAIISLYDANKSVDILTVIEELRRKNELDAVGGAYYVTKLTNSVVSTANIEYHCKVILEKYLKREAIKISGEFLHDAYEDSTDAFDIYDSADNKILNAQERVLGGSVKDMSYYASKVYNEYETVKQSGILGLKTGIEPIDRIFSGLVPPDLFIIAARPSQGKTALALSITHHLSILNKVPCAWFSLEMDGVQLTRRLASIDADIPHETIRHGNVYESLEKKFYDSLDRVSKSPIYIEDKTNVNVRSIRTRANVLVRKNGIKFIIVDYLQLMEGIDAKNKNRNDIIGEISRGLKCLAKELKLPVIALSQLSREVEKRSDKMPQMSDLRESGAIEQDADEVLFLMRPEKYGFTEPVTIGGKEYDVGGLCIGKADKNRHGECVNFPMSFVGNCMKFATHPNDIIGFQQPFNEIQPPSSNWKPIKEQGKFFVDNSKMNSGDFDEGFDTQPF